MSCFINMLKEWFKKNFNKSLSNKLSHLSTQIKKHGPNWCLIKKVLSFKKILENQSRKMYDFYQKVFMNHLCPFLKTTVAGVLLIFITACGNKEILTVNLPDKVKVGVNEPLQITIEKQGFSVTNVQKQDIFYYELLPDGQQSAVIEPLADTINQLDNSNNTNIAINGKNIAQYNHEISTNSIGKDTIIFSINSYSTIYRIISKDSVVRLKMALALKDNETLRDTAFFSLIN